VAGDHRDGARQPALYDFAIDELGDFGESGAGKTDGLGVEVRRLSRCRGATNSDRTNKTVAFINLI